MIAMAMGSAQEAQVALGSRRA